MLEILTFAEKLAGASLAMLLIVVLVGGYRRWWVWGHQYVEMRADYQQRLQARIDEYEHRLEAAERKAAEWQRMALRAAGIAENSVEIAKKRVTEE
jgi:hypothetical protein